MFCAKKVTKLPDLTVQHRVLRLQLFSIFFISIANFPASPAENSAAEEKSPVPYYFFYFFYHLD
jgi:hypothetical protein